jgi:DNA-binding winged helix-turn-helix (wHTH) protein/tetratricopeptide (TPR) repeat protein
MTTWQFEPFFFDDLHRTLTRDAHTEVLPHQVAVALTELLRGSPDLVPQERLEAAIWPDVVVSGHSLRQVLRKLRTALDDDAKRPRFIQTVRGRGYRLLVPCTATSHDPPALPAVEAPSNLPPTDPLVGRDDDLAAVLAALDTHRSVRIAGPAGVGKTALAIAAANARLERFRDGVWFCDAYPVQDRWGLLDAVWTALEGLTHRRSCEGFHALARVVSGAELLLVVDNLEHLEDVATEVLDGLSARAPGLRLLTTSRDRRRTPGEHLHELDPLSEDAAVTLVRRQAGATWSPEDEPVVTEVVRHLGGLPLALSLATEQRVLLSWTEVLTRLRDGTSWMEGHARGRPARHAHLHRALEGSWNLLDDAEREVLHACATVFREPFALSELQPLLGRDPLRTMRTLVDRCLLQRLPGPRFRGFPVVFEFVRAHSQPEIATRLWRRRATDLVGRVEAADRGELVLLGVATLRQQLRAATPHIDDPELRVRCLVATVIAQREVGASHELLALLDEALALTPDALRSWVLMTRARTRAIAGDAEGCLADVARLEALGEGPHLDRARSVGGWAHAVRGRRADAEAMLDAAIRSAQARHDHLTLARVYDGASGTHRMLGDLDEADRFSRLAIAHAQRTDAAVELATMRMNHLIRCESVLPRAEALATAAAAIETLTRAEQPTPLAMTHHAVGIIALADGDRDVATHHLARAAELLRGHLRRGFFLPALSAALVAEERTVLARRCLDEVRDEVGEHIPPVSVLGLHQSEAAAWLAMGDPARAAEILRSCPPPPADAREWQIHLALRTVLGLDHAEDLVDTPLSRQCATVHAGRRALDAGDRAAARTALFDRWQEHTKVLPAPWQVAIARSALLRRLEG